MIQGRSLKFLSSTVFICHKRCTGVLGLGETGGRGGGEEGGGGGGGDEGGGDEGGGGGGGEMGMVTEVGEFSPVGWKRFERGARRSPHGNWQKCQQLAQFKLTEKFLEIMIKIA